MNKLFKQLFFCLVFFIISCKKESTDPAFVDTPIVQAYLSPGNPVSLNITRQTPFSSNAQYSSDNINALKVFITTNNKTYTLTPIGNGQYVDSSLIVSDTSQYSLSFGFNGKTVTASTPIPSKPENFGESETSITVSSTFSFGTIPEPLRLGWSNTDGSYYIVVVKNIETDPVLIDTSSNAPSFSFVQPPTTSDSELINGRQFKYYGKTLLILYHVNPDYAALYNNSTTSSQNLTPPSSDITNGYGIFTGLNADTLTINVKSE